MKQTCNAKFMRVSQLFRAFSMLFGDFDFLTSTKSEEDPN